MNTIIPAYIIDAISLVLLNNPEYLTSEGSSGQCVCASDKLLFKCDEILGTECDGRLSEARYYKDLGSHYCAEIEGFCIDLTAKQFNKDAPCPKIWFSKNNLS